eukprot:scaffold59_cov114-Alexandrium_tamarense.AAC.3
MNVESLSGCIPVRLGGFHICHPPWFFGKVAFPLMKLVMRERMRKRVRVHVGSEEKVLKELEEVGMGREVLPSEIGGDVVLDNDGWMQDMVNLYTVALFTWRTDLNVNLSSKHRHESAPHSTQEFWEGIHNALNVEEIPPRLLSINIKLIGTPKLHRNVDNVVEAQNSAASAPNWDYPIWDTPYCAYLIGPRELASYAMQLVHTHAASNHLLFPLVSKPYDCATTMGEVFESSTLLTPALSYHNHMIYNHCGRSVQAHDPTHSGAPPELSAS